MEIKLRESFERVLIGCIDSFFMLWPQPFPGHGRLKACKIVSHRGEHDNSMIFENTIDAFDLAYEKGVWGIEFDVRWTKDLYPVVIHDADLKRVFGIDLSIGDVTWDELKLRCPAIPSLPDVIEKYGKKLHLMTEIKAETYPDPGRQNDILKECFSFLEPRGDYHLMSLSPDMLDLITFVPASTLIPIATLNIAQLSDMALEKDYCGVAGHYLLLNNTILAKHHKMGQHVGTGYPASKNCLFREINRGVEWIFSNKAAELQGIANKLADIAILRA
jgi:glycerophosphoryl diester phosphodiesterase